ncbi:MAG: sulfatase-like hydrolase/transferase [Zoogloeaceae bacterium]|jgi:phosphoglycerol transferase MdoB-like AlkP superfamily enzyme|nr:sulfatase-like hydrolase/transferase [Zoogloeaceae bacterium]
MSKAVTPAVAGIGLRDHLVFLFSGAALLLALLTLLRLALLLFNHELMGETAWTDWLAAFGNGLRFDLRLVVWLCLPLTLALACRPAMRRRAWQRGWLGGCASLLILLGMIELNFYQEFHQRLNTLAFQYLREDPATVLSMLWHGFPVLRLLLVWLGLSVAMFVLLARLDGRARRAVAFPASAPRHALALLLCLMLSVLAARGTLRQGPPLRWGDAFTTNSVFANHLGLNGALSLYEAAKSLYSDERVKIWPSELSIHEATALTREMLLTPHDTLVDAADAAVRRDFSPPQETRLPVRNIVVILMESFAGRFVGALGSDAGITPNFDRLAEEGLLFRRFFANGTHTHQGMFASMACFPNLPGFEYLMQTPEGRHQFSGLAQLLSARGYDNLYVYNGDFAWDNQRGFFSNQGMTRFIGRHDFIDPVVNDPTWGVSDEDMFARAAKELQQQNPEKPFYALLQTLSNHTPYALPDNLPVEPVTGYGSLDEHLTAMRYSDWALGQFFEKARQSPYFKDTLFVVVGDHGFGAREQLTEMDLYRFHVPLLLIAPGIRQTFGATRDTVGSQVDIVPTLMGRLGEPVRHQCWGRDLLSLPASDQGFAIIKPSGNDQTVAILQGERILVKPEGLPPRGYQYPLGASPKSLPAPSAEEDTRMSRQLDAYLHAATRSLMENTAGISGDANDIFSDDAAPSPQNAARPPDWAEQVDERLNLYRMRPRLYRSALPGHAGKARIRELGIATVINFYQESDAGWLRDPQVRQIHLPLRADRVSAAMSSRRCATSGKPKRAARG